MDKWKDLELEKMKVGGNQKAREFFESQEDWDDSMTIQQKYNTRAAALYRDKILALSSGKEWDLKKAQSTIAKSSNSSSQQHSSTMSQSRSSGAIANSYQNDDGNSGYQDGANLGYQNVNSTEFRDKKHDFFNRIQMENASKSDNLPPNQGGKYAGFGNTRDPPPRSQSTEIFDTTLSSLASGWSMLSFGASKVANVAKENAFKYGSLASQKVVEVSNSVSDKVDFVLLFVWIHYCLLFTIFLYYFCIKVKEGSLLESAGKEVTSLAFKVRLSVFMILIFFYCSSEIT